MSAVYGKRAKMEPSKAIWGKTIKNDVIYFKIMLNIQDSLISFKTIWFTSI